jgi:hypothetical protein
LYVFSWAWASLAKSRTGSIFIHQMWIVVCTSCCFHDVLSGFSFRKIETPNHVERNQENPELFSQLLYKVSFVSTGVSCSSEMSRSGERDVWCCRDHRTWHILTIVQVVTTVWPGVMCYYVSDWWYFIALVRDVVCHTCGLSYMRCCCNGHLMWACIFVVFITTQKI